MSRAGSSNRSSRCKKLLETRDKLRDLLTKVDRSEDLEGLLERILQNSEEIKKLSGELGVQGARRAIQRGG